VIELRFNHMSSSVGQVASALIVGDHIGVWIEERTDDGGVSGMEGRCGVIC
jgi:hypothetical protein